MFIYIFGNRKEIKMPTFVIMSIIVMFDLALTSKDSQLTSKIAELDNEISHSLKEPEKGSAKFVIDNVRLFNSLYRKVIKAVLSTKEQELHGKKVQLAEIVIKTHPHFVKLKLDEEKLINQGEWGEADLKSIKHLFVETQELKNKLENSLRKHKRVQ